MAGPALDDMLARRLARRVLLRAAAGSTSLALLALAACAGSSGVTTSTTTSAAGAPSPATATAAGGTSSAASRQAAQPSAAASSAGSAATTTGGTAVTSSSPSDNSATASGRATLAALPDAQTLRVNLGVEPGTIDPNLVEFIAEIAVVRQVFEPLVLLDKDLKPIPGAAERWTTSADGLTWTFTIRDHTYSDGVKVRAQDFEYSFKRILDPAVAAPYAGYFAGVLKGSAAYNGAAVGATSAAAAATPRPMVTPDQLKALRDAVGVHAADDSTLVFALEQPAGYFLDLVSLPCVPPLRQDLVGSAWTADVKRYIGNGPFVLVERLPQDHVTFAPNPSYWGGAPKIGLRYRVITDRTAAFAAYRNGELDVDAPAAGALPSIKADAVLGKELHSTPQLAMSWLYVNVKRPPLDNARFRQALSQAIDRERFVSDQLKGYGTAAAYLIPEGMPGYDPKAGAAFAFNPAAAKASLQAAGIAPPARKLSILCPNDAVTIQRLSFLVAMLKQNLGLEVALQPREAKAGTAALQGHDFDLAYSGWGADYPDPQDWYDLFRTGDGNNHGQYSNKQYDDLVRRADAEADVAKRLDLYAQAAKILLSDQPALILYQTVQIALVKPYVQQYTPTAQDDIAGDYFYKSIRLDPH